VRWHLSKMFFVAWKRSQRTRAETHDHRLQGSKKEQQRNDEFSGISKKGSLTMQSVMDLWQRIEHWLTAYAPHILETFNPGASEAQMVEAEAMLGLALPEDFKAFYRIHNGGGAGFLAIEGMDQGLLPLNYVMQTPRVTIDGEPGFVSDSTRKRPPVQAVQWHTGWVMFAEDGSGNSLCLDMAPAAGGQVGQVFAYDHDDGGPTWVIAPSFAALLAQWAEWLEAGYYQFDEFGGGGSLEATQDGYNEYMMVRDKPMWKETS
jgi:cell wall assembly regulator SMI1